MLQYFLTLTLLTVVESSHVQNNSDTHSDIIVTYSGHAEAVDPIPIPKPVTGITTTVKIPEIVTETTLFVDEDTESVLFVPNEKPVFRGDYNDDGVSIDDVIRKTGDKKVRLETETPSQDILFISGKNKEIEEKPKKEKSYNYNQNFETGVKVKEHKQIPLDCSNLDCSNNMKTVCGAKMENRHWRYRVFLNECYFRKVNCEFKYDFNRYKVMPAEYCKQIASHRKPSERPFVHNPPLPLLPKEKPTPANTRRGFSSRRSLNIEIDGSFCSHSCPSSCPEVYSPECAITNRGQRRVFENHCKLDYNSCSYGTGEDFSVSAMQDATGNLVCLWTPVIAPSVFAAGELGGRYSVH